MKFAQTKLCLVIGDPVAHSLSPLVHNAALKELGLSDQYVFLASEVKAEQLSDAVQGIKALGVRGASCTLPHKENIIALLDNLDPVAQAIGAVNTVVNQNGKLIGYNTDVEGIVLPLEKRRTLHGAQVAILGAGGAARAATYGLKQAGAHITIFSRTRSKAERLANDFAVATGALSESQATEKFEIIINTTPLGMKKGETPLSEKFLNKDQLIFDIVYNPLVTNFLAAAERKGAETISGLEMFIVQAAKQFKLYTGHDAPEEVMLKVAKRFLV